MVRIVYFGNYGNDWRRGVNNKMVQQASNLSNLCPNVELVLLGGTNTQYPNYSFIRTKELRELDISTRWNVLLSFNRQRKICLVLKHLIESLGSNDILYLRYPYPFFYINFPPLYKKINCKIITEHNTIEADEFRLYGSYIQLYKDLFFGGSLRKQSNGIVGVTEEITRYELMRSGDADMPHATIGNGITVKEIPLRKHLEFTGKELNLICVANISRWHGLDRLLNGISEYRGPIKIRLDIVGVGDELTNLKGLTIAHKQDKTIIFHGFLSGKLLNDLFDSSHLAVGSLGIHRKGLRMTSELKIREYCARGIPFFYSAFDSDFPNEFSYALRLPVGESSVDLEKIITFANEVYHHPNHSIEMRKFASEYLDWSVKIKKFIEFFNLFLE